ncbi:MAG: membrane protein insertase YidC [Deltaproteobacteria bacterium]|nr:membrane protein insertase YidC [Deltaproteobacteria bacterium]
MEKRLIIAIILSVAIILLWNTLFPPPKPKRAKRVVPQQEEKELPPPEETYPLKEWEKEGGATPPPPSLERPSRAPLPPEEEIVVTTDLYAATFSSRGARLKSLRLLRYQDKLPLPGVCFVFPFTLLYGNHQPQHEFEPKDLVNVQGTGNYPLHATFEGPETGYFAEASFAADTGSLELYNDKPRGEITFSWTSKEGVLFTKTFVFSNDNYFIDYNFTIANNSNKPLEGSPVVEWTTAAEQPGKKKKGGLFGGMGGDIPKLLYLISDEVNRKELTDIQEKEAFSGEIKWAGFEDKYFISALIPGNSQNLTIKTYRGINGVVGLKLASPSISIPPNTQQTFPFALYLGPKDMGDLEKGKGELGRVLSFGFWDPVAKPMLFILKLFYKFIPNYGLAIIFLSVLIKVVFWPLTHKGQKSMKEMQKGMQALQPKLAELKEKYKNKKDELNRRTMELYKTHKVNPLGGCLPLLIQFPVFIALYRVLLSSIELRHAPFISFWINDLATKDPTYISPLVMGASMFVQQKMTPTAGDPTQAKMMLLMPIVFTFMFLNFPSGLVFYWLVSNVLSIGQQYYVNKHS